MVSKGNERMGASLLRTRIPERESVLYLREIARINHANGATKWTLTIFYFLKELRVKSVTFAKMIYFSIILRKI